MFVYIKFDLIGKLDPTVTGSLLNIGFLYFAKAYSVILLGYALLFALKLGIFRF